MQETYNGTGKIKKLSPYQIRKMKENMRKVPEIQKKSDLYHRQEAESAEQLLSQIDETPSTRKRSLQQPTPKSSRWDKIKNYLFN